MDQAVVKKRSLHPIIMIDYVPRIVGHTSGFLMVVSTLYTQGNRNWIPYVLSFMQAAVWPHVALYLSIRSKNPKPLELRLLLLDSFFCGCWVAYLDFALLPSIALLLCVLMGQMSVQGFILTAKGIGTELLGLVLILIFHGFHYHPETAALPTIISITELFAFTLTMGYLTFARAAGLKETKNKLRLAYHEVENLNKILQAASSTLDLTKIMEQISAAINVFFNFNYISLQIVDETHHELFFKALYNTGTTTTKGDISILHPKLNYENCLSVKAFIDNEPVYIPEITSDMELSYIDKNLLGILGFKAVLYVPLSVQDKTIGVIGFYKTSKMVLTERTINSVRLQLSHISLNISNAILYEDLKQKAH